MAKPSEYKSPSRYLSALPSGGGRPKLVINEEGKQMIEVLAGYFCTDEEIANTLGTTVDSLHNKNNDETFLECKKRGLAKGKVSLRRNQMRLSEKNAVMAIFLGKQFLDQRDEPERAPADDSGFTINYDYGGGADGQ